MQSPSQTSAQHQAKSMRMQWLIQDQAGQWLNAEDQMLRQAGHRDTIDEDHITSDAASLKASMGFIGLVSLSRDKESYAGGDRILYGISAIGDEFGQREASLSHTITEITPIAPNVVALPKMHQPIALAGNCGILISRLPSFNDRNREQGNAVGLENAKHFRQGRDIIDMFEDMRTNHTIEALVCQIDCFDVQLKVDVVAHKIGSHVFGA
jgi:hypothetical protein